MNTRRLFAGGLLVAISISILGIELAACSSFSGAGAMADGASDVSELPETSFVDSADAADAADASDTAPPFPITPLVPVLTGTTPYSIEATEVTNAEFRDFKTAFGAEAGAPWASCPGKMALGPVCSPGSAADDAPVTCVDACDAQSYCAAIGRYLCGAIGGGPTPAGQETLAIADQWTRACEGPNGTAYPYGAKPSDAPCNTAPEAGVGALDGVGKHTACQGGEMGVFDMSGNASEWENDCHTDGTGHMACAVRGGSVQQSATVASCSFLTNSASGSGYQDVGFRCCATP